MSTSFERSLRLILKGEDRVRETRIRLLGLVVAPDDDGILQGMGVHRHQHVPKRGGRLLDTWTRYLLMGLLGWRRLSERTVRREKTTGEVRGGG